MFYVHSSVPLSYICEYHNTCSLRALEGLCESIALIGSIHFRHTNAWRLPTIEELIVSYKNIFHHRVRNGLLRAVNSEIEIAYLFDSCFSPLLSKLMAYELFLS